MKSHVKSFGKHLNEQLSHREGKASGRRSPMGIAEYEALGDYSNFGRLIYGTKVIPVPYPEDTGHGSEFTGYAEDPDIFAKWVCKNALDHGIAMVYFHDTDEVVWCQDYA